MGGGSAEYDPDYDDESAFDNEDCYELEKRRRQ